MRQELAQEWLGAFTLEFADDLRQISGVSPASERGQKVLAAALGRFEALLTRLLAEIENENSRLSRELEAADVDRSFLRSQLVAMTDMTREASRTSRRRWLASAVLALGAIFGSVVTGAAEGIASEVVSSIAAKEDDRSAGLEQLALCSDILVGALQDSGAEVTIPRMDRSARPSGEALKAELDDLLDGIDETLETNREEFVKSYIQRGGE